MTSDAENLIQETEQTLLAYCRQQGLFRSGDRVIAACSGGADSMALLLFLLRRRRELEIEVLATHVNHGIRGRAGPGGCRFRQRVLPPKTAWNCSCTTPCAKGVEIPAQPSEEWARGLRYGWFDHLAAQEEALIATAHTMSDQAETVLFRMARGHRPARAGGHPAARRGYYVRPCLCLGARRDRGILRGAWGNTMYRDETNAQDLYARNRIRHAGDPRVAIRQPGGRKKPSPGCAAKCVSWTSG